ELRVGLVRDRTWRRDAHPSADRLDEASRRGGYLGLLLDVRHLDRREPDSGGADANRGLADVALAEITGRHDAAVLDVDVGPQLVRLAEPAPRPQRLDVV